MATTIPGTHGIYMDDVMCLNGDQGEELIGIVVGSGDFPETSLDEDMEARIGAETLAPSRHHFTEEEDEAAHHIVLTRSFSNVTGDVVEVNEIGILLHTYADLWYRVVTGHQSYYPYLTLYSVASQGWHWYGLVARDALGSPESVPALGGVTVQYVFEVSKN